MVGKGVATRATLTVEPFDPTPVELTLSPGERFLNVCDQHPEAEVPFSCRAATCGTCRVEVLEGLEGLAPAGDEERDLLEAFGEGPRVRLACQMEVGQSPPSKVRLRVVEPF